MQFSPASGLPDDGDDLAPQIDDAAHVVGHPGQAGDGVLGDELHHLLRVDAVEQVVGDKDEIFVRQDLRGAVRSGGVRLGFPGKEYIFL